MNFRMSDLSLKFRRGIFRFRRFRISPWPFVWRISYTNIRVGGSDTRPRVRGTIRSPPSALDMFIRMTGQLKSCATTAL